ncbi:MAG: transglutaminase domain-containing protein [Methylobacter sp.]
MNPELLLLSFGLLSWGWLSQTWPWALGLLFGVAVAEYGNWRLSISAIQFYRCTDLSALLVLMLLADVYVLQPVEQPIYVLLKWLPVLLAPALFAQLFSYNRKLPLASLFYSLRRRQSDNLSPYNSLYKRESDVVRLLREIDFIQPYAALTVLSAGAANVRTPAYFIVSATLFAGILRLARPKHAPLPAWLLTVALAIVAGYLGSHGLKQLNDAVEQHIVGWLGNTQTDAFKSFTAIGDIGELKLSNNIEFRVKADGPLLLHQASYDLFYGQQWSASKPQLMPEPTSRPGEGTIQQLEILQQFERASAVLPLPDGTVNITGLADASLQYTGLGAVIVRQPERFARYRVFYTGRRTGAPSQYDLQVPKQHQDWLRQFSDELQLENQHPFIVAERIKKHFQRNFFYSAYLGRETDADLALKDFMLNRKAGHCEYFAAATVLLLRQAGIPARLANGYAVSEYDSEQDLYIVRSRHAHAWASAYINGIWQTVDSTPAHWLALESERASQWQSLGDWWSNNLFYFRQWQLRQSPEQTVTLELLGALLLALYLIWRFFPTQQQRSHEKPATAPDFRPGLDSEFYLIEQRLQNTAQARRAHESMQQWVARLQHPALEQLYKLHYRLRFDPLGLTAEQRQRLRQARKWADDFDK